MSNDRQSSWSRNAAAADTASRARASVTPTRGTAHTVEVPPAAAGGSSATTTSIAAGCGLKGELYFTGLVELNCRVEGKIAAEGELILGERAQVVGDIRAERLVVFGVVRGDIVCSERLELHAGAKVEGTLCSPRLVMHDGVHFEGECSMPTEEGYAEPESDSSSQEDKLANE